MASGPPGGVAIAGRVPLAYNGELDDYSQWFSTGNWGFAKEGEGAIIDLCLKK